MPQQDPQFAARDRDLGMRRISRLTWQAGLAGAACAAVLAVSLGHHGAAASATLRSHGGDQRSIVIPAQPPQPTGSLGQVTSGAS
jgi:hypothetical protein